MAILHTFNWTDNNTSSTAKTINFGQTFTPAAGSLLVVIAVHAASFATWTSGWTKEKENTSENAYRNAVFTKISDGTETSFSWNQNGPRAAAATVYELPSGSTIQQYIDADWTQVTGAQFLASSTTHGPYTGEKVWIEAFGYASDGAQTIAVTSTGGQVIDHQANVDVVGSESARLLTASAVIADGASITPTWGGSTGNGYRIRILFDTPSSIRIQSSPSALNFSFNTAGLVDSKNIVVGTTDTPGGITITASENTSWLTVSPSVSTNDPTTFSVVADSTGLANGDYNAQITFSASGYLDHIVDVGMRVGPLPYTLFDGISLPAVAATDASVNLGGTFSFTDNGYLNAIFYYKPTSAVYTNVPIFVSNVTEGTTLYSGFLSTNASGWIRIDLAEEVAVQAGSQYMVHAFFQQGVSWTNYVGYNSNPITSGPITLVKSNFGYSEVATIPTRSTSVLDPAPGSSQTGNYYGFDVNYLVGTPPPRLKISGAHTAVSRWFMQGESETYQVLAFISDGSEAPITASSPDSWVTVTPTSGNAPLLIDIEVDTTSLTEGSYSSQVTISASGYDDIIFPINIDVYALGEQISVFNYGPYGSNATHAVDPASYTLGTQASFSQSGKIFSLLYYKAGGGSFPLLVFGIGKQSDYSSTLVTVPFSSFTNGWNRIDLPTPYQVEKDTDYIITVSIPASLGYTYSSSLFATPRSSVDGVIKFKSGMFVEGMNKLPTTLTSNGYGHDVIFVPDPLPHVLESTTPSFDLQVKQGKAVSRSFIVSSVDVPGVSISQSDDANWMLVSPSNGISPRAFSFYIDTSTMSVGSYSANITFTADTYPDLVVPVNINVIDPDAALSVWYPDAYQNASTLNDGTTSNIGTEFRFEVDGLVKELLWYKASSAIMANTNIHISDKSNGQVLAQGTINVSAQGDGQGVGWKKVTLVTPLEVSKEGEYVVWMNFSSAYVKTYSPNLFDGGSIRNNSIIAVRGRRTNSTTSAMPTATDGHGYGFDVGYTSYDIVPEILPSSDSYSFILELNASHAVTISAATSDSTNALISATSNSNWISVDSAPVAEPASFTVYIDTTSIGIGNYYGSITLSAEGYPDKNVLIAIAVVDTIETVYAPDTYPNASLAPGTESYTLGNRFRFSSNGYVTELWLNKLSTGLYAKKTLYLRNETTNTTLATTSVDPQSDTGWFVGVLAEPVAVNSTDSYVVYSFFPTGEQFTRSVGLMSAGPIVNGSISMTHGLYTLITGVYGGSPPTTSATYGYGFDLGFSTTSLPKYIKPSRTSIQATIEAGQPLITSFTAETSDLSGATISVSDNVSWLNITPSSGTEPVTFTVTIDGTNLTEGTYHATITLSASGYQNFLIPVTLLVNKPKPTSNVISIENALAGDTAAGFDLAGAANGEPGYMGFSRQYSVNDGETIDFSIDGNSVENVYIYRIGYYNGTGRRLVATIPNIATNQPNGTTIPNSGYTLATSMSNWSITASWDVPVDTTSGLFVAVTRNTSGQAMAWIPFVVRNDSRDADIVIMTSDATWGCAYNYYGNKDGTEKAGASVYGSGGPIGEVNGIGSRAFTVSRDRPIVTRNAVVNHWDVLELPFIDWAEENGFDVKYIGSYDLDQQNVQDVLGNSKILLSLGHDEYWSPGMRDNAKAFRDSGKNLIFMSGNEVFWKVRWSEDGRLMWCYKDTMNNGVLLNPPEWTGTWRDTRWSDRQPEYWLTGTNFRMNGINDFPLSIVGQDYESSPFWRDTVVGNGANLSVSALIGFEADVFSPPDSGAVRLGYTEINIDGKYADDNGQDYTGNGTLYWSPNMFYATPTAGVTVGFGTCQWQWGLSNRHGSVGWRQSNSENREIKQATTNLLYDLGCYAVSLETGIQEPKRVPISAYAVTYTGINPIEPWPESSGGARFGNINIIDMRVGSQSVQKAYRGSTLVYQL